MSEAAARKYDPIAVSAESTVVAEYSPEPSTETAYQSEAELEMRHQQCRYHRDKLLRSKEEV